MGEPYHAGTNCGELVILSSIKLGLLPTESLEDNILNHLTYAVYIKRVNNNLYKKEKLIGIDPF